MVCSVGIGIVIAVWVVLLVAAVAAILYTARADSDGTFHWKWENSGGGHKPSGADEAGEGHHARSVSSASAVGSSAASGSRGHRRPRVVSTAVAIPPSERSAEVVGAAARDAERRRERDESLTPVERKEPDTMVLPVVSKISSKVVEIQAVGPVAGSWGAGSGRAGQGSGQTGAQSPRSGVQSMESASEQAAANAEQGEFPSEETNLG